LADANSVISNLSNQTRNQSDNNKISFGFGKTIIKAIANNRLIQSYILPSLMTGKDVLKVKNIRPLNSVLAIGAYLWITICILSCYYVVKKKKMELLLVIPFSVIFGLSTQTGFLEMSTYRGRSGWYLLFFALIGVLYFIDSVIDKIPKKLSYTLFLIIFIADFLSPPTYYRDYFIEPFVQALAIGKRFPNQKILFITNEKKVIIVSDQFYSQPLALESLGDKCQYDKCFLIFEKKFLTVDPILSQKALAVDKDFKQFKSGQDRLKSQQEATTAALMSSPNFDRYQKYWEDENIAIYHFVK
jgi:hypothetical protein